MGEAKWDESVTQELRQERLGFVRLERKLTS